MIESIFAQLCGDVFARQISCTDKEGEAFCPGIVRRFTLGLDVEVAVFHMNGRGADQLVNPTLRSFSFWQCFVLSPQSWSQVRRLGSRRWIRPGLPQKAWSREQARG